MSALIIPKPVCEMYEGLPHKYKCGAIWHCKACGFLSKFVTEKPECPCEDIEINSNG